MSHPRWQDGSTMPLSLLEVWRHGLPGGPHPIEAVMIAKLIKLAVSAGYLVLVRRALGGLL